MFRLLRRIALVVFSLIILCGMVLWQSETSFAAQVLMKDGRVLKGKHAMMVRVNESAANAEELAGKSRSILAIDDGLRRVFVPRYAVADLVVSDVEESLERFRIPRPQSEVSTDGKRISAFGSYRVYEPFDEFGRRVVVLNNQTPVEQSITEINPRYIVIRSRGVVWNMREATSNYPRDVISKILLKRIDPKNLEDRKRIARFYIQAERYTEAHAELTSIIDEFGADENVIQELQPLQKNLAQLEIEKIRQELELRRNAGQYEYVKSLLPDFPIENASVENLQAVRNMVEADADYELHREKIIAVLKDLITSVKEDSTLRESALPILDEIETELNQNTIDRFLPLQLLLDDQDTPGDQKLALGLSGWLVGADSAVSNLPLAISMHKTREFLKNYLTTTSDIQRESFLKSLEAEEAGTIETVAKILPLMKPLFPIPKKEDADQPGYYQLTTPAFADLPPYTYSVQLPPEYDPNHRYPLIVTLNGRTTPDQQLDWWCGNWRDGKRFGQAGRYGYIVIAPFWNSASSSEYDFSARSHGAALYSLYDAMRHFSIDSDRVFLTGHSTGGDAAWDIGISHPDLWAGVIPITASGRKYIRQYLPNAKHVPMYFVNGELDGVVAKDDNNYSFNNYLTSRYDCTVVNFLGRGHENFSDERLNLFDWMRTMKRVYPNKDFAVRSLRPWDNNFWWVEANNFSARTMLDPVDWTSALSANSIQPAKVEAKVNNVNGIRVTSNAEFVTVWLSPELIDFKQRIDLQINGRRVPVSNLVENKPAVESKPVVDGKPAIEDKPAVEKKSIMVEGKLQDMLEDVRTRFDRQHPFWLKVEYKH